MGLNKKDLYSSIADLVTQNKQERVSRDHALAFGRDLAWVESFKKDIQRLFKDKIQVPKPVKSQPREITRMVNVMLSDTHYGAALDPQENPLKYGWEEESRRTAWIAQQAVDFKSQYRDSSGVIVHLLGDMIHNQLHDPRDGAPLSLQVASAIRILTQFVGYLAAEFPTVQVYCVSGNHGRNKSRHPTRAVSQKWDSIETMIYYSAKTALAHVSNVTFFIPKTPYYIYSVFGSSGFMTHGDTVLKPGFPSSTIQIDSIRKQINEWRVSSSKDIKLFGVGHVHTGSIVHLPSGAIFMSNGALLPPDPFAVSIGSPQIQCGQWIWESVKGHIVGDHRFITVDKRIDSDTSLDKIIKPFTDL